MTTIPDRGDYLVHDVLPGTVRSSGAPHINRRSPETCREWVEDKMNCCFADAAFIVWGKLHPLEELGPRCMNHLPKALAFHLSRYGNVDGYAAFDLRPYWTEKS